MHEILDESGTEKKLEAECVKAGDHLYLRKGTELEIVDYEEDTQIVFSMGGKGTRLRHVTNDEYSKHIIDINGKPLSRYVVDIWIRNGFSDFCILVDDTHRGDSVRNYYKEGEELGVKIEYSIEHCKLGSGGAIKYAKNGGVIKKSYINHYPDDIIINYPNFAKDFSRLFFSAIKAGYQCVVLCVPGKIYPYGIVIDDKGKVTKFIEKPFIEKDTNTGIYGMSKDAFYLLDEIEGDKEVKIERTVLKKLAEDGKMLKVLLPTEFWIPVNDEPNMRKFIEISK